MPFSQEIEDSSVPGCLNLARLFGRVHRKFQKQCFELIGLCRMIQKAFGRVKHYKVLLSVIRAVDNAIRTCIRFEEPDQFEDPTPNKHEAQNSIKNALDTILRHYGELYPGAEKEFKTKLTRAQDYDEAQQAKLNKIMSQRGAKPKISEWKKGTTVDVDFVFPDESWKSHLVKRPLVLHPSSTFEEAIWLLSRSEPRLVTLQQNPQFYCGTLSNMVKKGPSWSGSAEPLEKPNLRNATYCVLLDRPHPVFFESSNRSEARLFGNLWRVDDTLILLKEYNGRVTDHMKLKEAMTGVKFAIRAAEGSSEEIECDMTWHDVIKRALESKHGHYIISPSVEMPQPVVPTGHNALAPTYSRETTAIPMPNVPNFPIPEPHVSRIAEPTGMTHNTTRYSDIAVSGRSNSRGINIGHPQGDTSDEWTPSMPGALPPSISRSTRINRIPVAPNRRPTKPSNAFPSRTYVLGIVKDYEERPENQDFSQGYASSTAHARHVGAPDPDIPSPSIHTASMGISKNPSEQEPRLAENAHTFIRTMHAESGQTLGGKRVYSPERGSSPVVTGGIAEASRSVSNSLSASPDAEKRSGAAGNGVSIPLPVGSPHTHGTHTTPEHSSGTLVGITPKEATVSTHVGTTGISDAQARPTQPAEAARIVSQARTPKRWGFVQWAKEKLGIS